MVIIDNLLIHVAMIINDNVVGTGSEAFDKEDKEVKHIHRLKN